MSGGGTQTSLRRALGAIKDTTTVNLAKVNSDFKELDIAIVKSTDHLERPAKEKHIKTIFGAISARRSRADVAYCIHAFARRLSKTHNWVVALKTLIVIHRALREVDPTFHEELVNHNSRNHMLNLAHFKDDSSPNAWDYSAWVRSYALFLEERLECFRVLKYDVEKDHARTKDLETPELLKQLPALQQLLFHVLGCLPQGAAVGNPVIQLALSMLASESIKVYNAISDGTVNLVDKFFEMQHHDALGALDIYQRAVQQAERLSDFCGICKSLGTGEKSIMIEQPPASFIEAMEEYVRETTQSANLCKDRVYDDDNNNNNNTLGTILSRPPSPPLPEPELVNKVEAPVVELPDLLNLNDPIPGASELDKKNALALAIVPAVVADQPNYDGPPSANGTTSWELALVAAPSSNEGATVASKLAGGLDKLTLDSLYDDAIRRSNQNVSYSPWEPVPMASVMMPPQALTPHYPFFSSTGAAPPSVGLAAFGNQQQQQQQMMATMGPLQQSLNPFDSPYEANVHHPYGSGMPVQSHNQYTGLI